MSIDSTARKQTFNMDGETLEFEFTFYAIKAAPEDIKCKLIASSSTITITDLEYDTDYTVHVNTGGEGGTVTVTDAQTANDQLLVYRDTTNTQESDYDDYNQFPASTVEADIDRRTLKSQELEDDISRAIKASITSDLSDIELPTPEAGKALVWNDDEDGITNYDVALEDVASYSSIAVTAANAASTSASTALASEYAAGTYATTAQEAANAIPSPTNGSVGQIIQVAPDNKSWEFADKGIIDTTPASDHGTSGIIGVFTANENQAIGDACYINGDGEMQIADADAIATSKVVAICADATISADASGNYLLLGIIRDDTWNWTVGGFIYLTVTGTSGNTLSQTAPSGADDCVVIVGVATHADRIYFNPQLVIVEHTG